MTFVNPGPAWLFCPADRPDRYEKAAKVADVAIIDLEDAVAPDDRPGARKALANSDLDPATTVVRINPFGTDDHECDLGALAATAYTTVMVPKAEHPDRLLAGGDYDVIALLETPAGVMRALDIASADPVVGVMWGAEDLVAAIGGASSRRDDGSYRDVARHARSVSLLAAAAAGRFALDTVHLDIPDVDGLRDEAVDAAAVGFAATVAIHPSQIAVIRAAYRPDEDELEWARAVVDEASRQPGVFSFRGTMVDAPVLTRARNLLTRAGA